MSQTRTSKSRLINFWISYQEEIALRLIAKQDGRNMSQTLKSMIRDEAKKRNFPPVGTLVESDLDTENLEKL